MKLISLQANASIIWLWGQKLMPTPNVWVSSLWLPQECVHFFTFLTPKDIYFTCQNLYLRSLRIWETWSISVILPTPQLKIWRSAHRATYKPTQRRRCRRCRRRRSKTPLFMLKTGIGQYLCFFQHKPSAAHTRLAQGKIQRRLVLAEAVTALRNLPTKAMYNVPQLMLVNRYHDSNSIYLLGKSVI